MKRLAGYPAGFYFWLLLALSVLLLSGFVLLPPMLEMRLELDIPWRVAGSLRLAAAAAHSSAGFVVAGMTGALLAIHIRIGWRRGLNRISGCALLVLLALMLASALGIFYFGDEQWSRWSSVAHCCAALCATPIFVWHAIRGRRLRRDPSVWKHASSESELVTP